MKELVRSCFSDIPADSPVIVAVSGGSDSLALLLLADAWARERRVELQAVTVDHGLRPEAAAEAAFVASIAAGMGIDHVTLAWEGEKPAFGVQAAARRSRYSLIDDFALETGAGVILTGHTLDDQAETVFMRAQRGGEDADGRGLSGMARRTWLQGDTLLYRPLLGVSRQTLRKVLADFGQSWIEDPSNLDESYERVRVRRYLAANPAMATRALAMARVAGRYRAVLASACATWLEANVTIEPGPVIHAGLQSMGANGRPDPVAILGIRILVALAGGGEHLMSRRRIAPVIGLCQREPGARLTIGGAVVERTGTGIRLYREMRNLAAMVVEPGETAIWDGRLNISNETATEVAVEPARRGLVKELEEARGAPFAVKPRQALWSSPAMHVQVQIGPGGQAAFLPLIENRALPQGLHVRLTCPAIENFCPEFDAPLRDWLTKFDTHATASLQPGG